MDDFIFTYIGPVLISVNPFKQMPYVSPPPTLFCVVLFLVTGSFPGERDPASQ